MLNIVKSSNQAVSIYSNLDAFEDAQRTAKAISSSEFIPDKFRNNIPNTLVAIDLSMRMNTSPLVIMQNLDVIKGSPRFSSSFVLSIIRSCGRFSDIEIKYIEDDKPTTFDTTIWVDKKPVKKSLPIKNKYCWIECVGSNGKTIKGPVVSLEMAFKEGWYTKSGSKWPTMPDMMLSYRAASFFGKIYVSDLLSGMGTTEEARDIEPETVETEATVVEDLNQKITPVSEPPVSEPPVAEPPVEDDPEEDTPGNWV